MMGKDKNKDKEYHDGETAAISKTNQDTQDLSRDHEAWDATLAQTITEAVAREMAKAHVHYQAILNKRGAATLQTSLKVSSGANGFKVMDPFNWTKDKSIYERWQLWSEKARLALKLSYQTYHFKTIPFITIERSSSISLTTGIFTRVDYLRINKFILP